MDGFNLDGTINPRNVGQQGLLPGAGVAQGGQQGRIGLMHGGIGGAARGGGYQPGASPRRVMGPSLQTPGLPPHVVEMLKRFQQQGGS